MEYGLKPLGRERLWLWAMLFPTLIGLVFGVFGSIMATIALSFTHWDLLTPPVWAGLSNYIALFTDPKLFKALTNTFIFSLLYVPGVVIISLLVAVLMNRKIHLFFAGCDLGGCYCPGLEYDLWPGHRNFELHFGTRRLSFGLLVV
jgi:ABC-type sugar transport system permease subunit